MLPRWVWCLQVERLIPIYKARLREQGIFTDPFERARRQEQLQQQQQQLRPAAVAAATHQHAGLPAGAAAPGAVPALPAPAAGEGVALLVKEAS